MVLSVPWILLIIPYSDQRSTKAMAIVTVLAAVLAIIYLLPIWISPNARNLLFWKILDASLVGICLFLVGLCDHISLTELLPKNASAHQNV